MDQRRTISQLTITISVNHLQSHSAIPPTAGNSATYFTTTLIQMVQVLLRDNMQDYLLILVKVIGKNSTLVKDNTLPHASFSAYNY